MLSHEEEILFRNVIRTQDFDLFTDRYFVLPMSGTWFTPEDREKQWKAFLKLWYDTGQPEEKIIAESKSGKAEFLVFHDPYYGNEPIFLQKHGFRTMPWMRGYLSPGKTRSAAVTGRGSGKAQPLDARVLTPDGWSYMGDIEKGDFVIGQDGLPKTVLGVYPQGVRPVYRVTFSDGSSTTADAEHLWLVDDGKGRPRSSWQIMPTSELLTRRQVNFIPFVEPVQYDKTVLPADPYLIGALIGDGYLNHETIKFSSADNEILDRVGDALPDELHLVYDHNYDYRISRRKLKGSLRNPLITVLRNCGLWGHRAEGKFIPNEYLRASCEDRIALLQGLLDTDGSAGDKAGIEYTTVSERLAEDVQELVLSLGGRAIISSRIPTYIYKGERRQGQRSYRLYIQFRDPDFNPFHLARKQNNYTPKTHHRLSRRVKSVEYIYDDEVQCIDVEDSLYITDDYIVTHNTAGVAIRALVYCALFPGFRFLNVAVTQHQADLMLGEIEKWILNSEFRKFIKPTRGTNPLWTMKPYPIISIEVYPGQPSTFICQTIGIEGRSIIGGERDWINVDESQLLTTIGEVHPILVTSLRGTRISGVPRWTKLSWLSNPGFNPEWLTLIEGYKERQDKGDKNVLVLEELATDLNIYITQRQITEQEKSLTEREQDRWMSGIATQLYSDSPFSEESIEACRNDVLTQEVDKIGKFHDTFGLMEYELPYDSTHTYVVAGDVGKSHLTSMNAQNVPVVMVFDITSFMEKPSRLAAFYWMDGLNTYETFQDKFIYACMKYRARSYYDATNIQSAFEDVGGFKDLPATQPVFFSGTASKKKYAVAVASLMMQNGMFEWPYIKGLWHQCRVYNPSSRKVPDDIVATILVFIFALQGEATLWTKFIEHFKFDTEAHKTLNIKGETNEMEDDWPDVEAPIKYDRYSRIYA